MDVAEPTVPSNQRANEPIIYAPFSGFAIAAILVSLGFAIILIATIIMSILSKRSSMNIELLLLAAVGIVLALIARSKIKNSEGTLGGLKVASAALWISFIGGAGFGAYIFANSLAVEQQSLDVANKFFKKLQEKKFTYAFVDSIEPERRGPANPEDTAELSNQFPEYNGFVGNQLIKLFERHGDKVEVIHKGSNSVEQAKAGFVVVHRYELKCPEGIFEVNVALLSAETKKGSKTPWQVIAGGSSGSTTLGIKPVELSAFGKMAAELEYDVVPHVSRWYYHYRVGELSLAHLMTIDSDTRMKAYREAEGLSILMGAIPSQLPLTTRWLPADRAKPRQDEQSARGLLAGGYASLLPSANLAFDDLYSIGFFRRDEAGTPYDSDKIKSIRLFWAQPMLGPGQSKPGGGAANQAPEGPRVLFSNGRPYIELSCDLYWNPNTYSTARVGVEIESEELKQLLSEALEKGASDLSAKTIGVVKKRTYRIAYFRCDFERKQIQQPGGPPGGPGGGSPR